MSGMTGPQTQGFKMVDKLFIGFSLSAVMIDF